MTVSRPHPGPSSRLVGYSILATVVALAAVGLWLVDVLLCVPFAFAIIGAGVALQLACRLAAGVCLTCLVLGKAIGSMAGRRILRPAASRPTFR